MKAPSSVEIIFFSEFQANLRTRELLKQGSKLRLPDQSFQVLAMLLEHAGKLVTRDEIRKALWPVDTFVDFDHSLNNAVNRLRDALGDSAEAPRFIETLPRRGYRFIGILKEEDCSLVVTQEKTPDEMVPTAEAQIDSGVRILRNRPMRLALIIGLIALSFVAGVILRKQSRLPSTRSFILPPDGVVFNLVGDRGGFALSPDGTKLAFIAVDRKGTALIWVRPVAKLTAEPIAGTDGAIFPFWSPDGQSIGFFADAKLKKIKLGGGPPEVLCDASIGRGGSWSDRGFIIFSPDTHSPIFKVPESGGAPVPVTRLDPSMHTTHRWPRFLPDGNHFVYFAASHYPNALENGVYFGSLDSESSKLLVNTDADAAYASGYLFYLLRDVLVAQPFSPETGKLTGEPRLTGEKVLYDRSIWKSIFDVSNTGVMTYQLGEAVSGMQLRWYDRSGTPLGDIGPAGFQFEPRLSPDGRKLAAGAATRANYSGIWLYDLSSTRRSLVTQNEFDNGAPVWFPDGNRLLITQKRQHYSIYEVDQSGAGPERLVLDTGKDIWPLDISPEGRFLIYGEGVGPERNHSKLWICDLHQPSERYQFWDGSDHQDFGQFSPDGKWIAYASRKSGREEIYVAVFDANNKAPDPRGLQISMGGGHRPRWNRNSKELFYMADDGTLMSVGIARERSSLRVAGIRPLFRASSLVGISDSGPFEYDVRPEGNRFLIESSVPETTAPITLVANWPSEYIH